jgi:Protein of unknown function (DUF3667)
MSDFQATGEHGSPTAAVAIAASALAERGHKTGTCANCEAHTIGAYCVVCGQERDTHRRSVWGLVKDLIEDIISFDSRILRTAIALLVEPGEIPKAFREGRTQRYVPSLRLYFFVSLIFFLILSMTGLALVQMQVTAAPVKVTMDKNGRYYMTNQAYDPKDTEQRFIRPFTEIPKDEATQLGGPVSYSTNFHFFSRIGAYHSQLTPAQRYWLVHPHIEAAIDNAAHANKKLDGKKAKAVESWFDRNVTINWQRVALDPTALNGPLTTWIPRMLFLLLPLYAFSLFLFYWPQHQKFYFVDHLIFSLPVHSFLFVVLIVDVGLAQILSGESVAWLTVAALGIYIFVAMKRFYEQGWFRTTVKFCCISFIYSVFFLTPAIAGVLALSFFGDSIG